MSRADLGDRPLPSDVGIEEQTIGILLSLEDEPHKLSRALMALEPGDFHSEACRALFNAAMETHRRNDPVNVITVGTRAPEHLDYALGLAAKIATTVILDFCLRRLKELSAQRKGIKLSYALCASLYDTDDTASLMGKAAEDLYSASRLMLPGAVGRDAASIKGEVTRDGIRSGFVTHDYNDGGFKAGGWTLLTGFRGDGKTTIARQFGVAAAMQGIKVFVFSGEAPKEREKNNWARLFAEPGEIRADKNTGGRPEFTSPAAELRFNERFKGLIHFTDLGTFEGAAPGRLFDDTLAQMHDFAQQGYYLFILDNMSVLNQGEGNKEFDEQARISAALNKFKVRHNAHVILICHQAKGQTRVTGKSKQEDLADTVLRYVRVRPQNAADIRPFLSRAKLPPEITNQVSALLLVDKVRDGGTEQTAYLSWNGTLGACVELSTFEYARMYEDAGFWVKAVSRFQDLDRDLGEPTGEPTAQRLPYKE
ncbi:MAG: AAA family ATPase [Victivallales bacterium]|nr:AAA family ATPase [Victivallales bacterium]